MICYLDINIIPISFNICQVLDNKYYSEKYSIQMRSQAKSSGIKLLEVHGMGKNLDPNLKPEKQHAIPKQGSMERPHIGQKGLDQEEKDLIPSINQLINHPPCHKKFLEGQKWKQEKTNHVHAKDLMHSINNVSGKMTNNIPFIPDVPFYPDLVYRPQPKPMKQDMLYPQNSQSSTSVENINTNINFDFEENSPFQEGIISKTFQRVGKSFFQETKE